MTDGEFGKLYDEIIADSQDKHWCEKWDAIASEEQRQALRVYEAGRASRDADVERARREGIEFVLKLIETEYSASIRNGWDADLNRMLEWLRSKRDEETKP